MFELMSKAGGVPAEGGELGRTSTVNKIGKSVPDSPPTPTESSAEGQCDDADDAGSLLPDALPTNEGQAKHAAKVTRVVPSAGDDGGRLRYAEKAGEAVPPSSPAIDTLAELQVRRKFYIGVVNKQTNAVKALVRRALGWRAGDEEVDRTKVNARAARIVAAALAGKDQKPEDADIFNALALDLAVITAAIEPCHKARHNIELEMKRIVRKLPVYPWAKAVTGFGELGLAVVIAEAGDLAKYPKKGHLWKRLGLAVHGDKAYSTWRMKGGLTAEEWTAAGYSPRRRAEVFAVISEPLFRAQSVAQGPYRAVYDRRRAATAEAHADWTKAHSHMDALRVMTKYLLRDLWREWRRAVVGMPQEPSLRCPPPNF